MADEIVVAPAPAAVEAPAPSWRDGLPDDLKADKSLADFKDVTSLAKSYVSTKAMVGAKPTGVTVPTDKSTPEEIAAYRKAVGVPDAPTGYTFKRPAMASVMGWDERAEQGFAAAAHAAGMTPAHAQAVVDYYGRMEQARFDANREMERQAGTALRAAWGANYEANVGWANRALQQFGGDELVEYLHTSKLGADPRMVKAWAEVGQALGEHGVIRGDAISGVSRADAQMKADEIRTQLKGLNPDSPQAKDLVDQLYRYLAVK